MEKHYKRFKKWVCVFLSMNIMAVAIILFLSANVGSDPLTIFEDGVSRVCVITLGQASLCFNSIIIAIALCIARKNIGIATIVYAVFVGYVIDLWYPLHLFLAPIQEASYLIRILLLVLAQNFMCFAFALLLPLKLGMSCFDAVIYALQEKYCIPYTYLRITFDTTIMIIGYLWGAKIGFGTMFSICLTGYMIPFYTKCIDSFMSNRQYILGE